jgi:hypothetical protein
MQVHEKVHAGSTHPVSRAWSTGQVPGPHKVHEQVHGGSTRSTRRRVHALAPLLRGGSVDLHPLEVAR